MKKQEEQHKNEIKDKVNQIELQNTKKQEIEREMLVYMKVLHKKNQDLKSL